MLSGNRPAVALFCATFLKPEMLHVHRHIEGLQAFRPVVLTQKREGDWAVETIHTIRRSPWRFLARGGEKRTGKPWQISGRERGQMLAVIEAEGCSLLHVFFGNAAIHLLPLLRECPVPVVVSFHGSDVAGSMASVPYAEGVKELFAMARLVPCRSEQLAKAVGALGCPEEKLRIMRTVLPDVPMVRREPPVNGEWRIVQAARLVAKKGISTALRAFAEFSKKYPGAKFIIAGEGPLDGVLRAEAEALGLGGRVEFRGFLPQEELREVFSASHIFLHPSETVGGDVEGVPNAMLEAMAMGLPVVATQHGGIPEVICDGVDGFLCPEGDSGAIAGALERLASDGRLYEAIANQGATMVRERFSAGRQIAAIESLYREAVLA